MRSPPPPPPRRRRGSSKSKELGAYLAWRIREWIKSGKGRTSAELAKLAGISGAQVSNLRHGHTGAGWKTAEGLGRVFEMSMPELIAAAEKWATSPDRQAGAKAPKRTSRAATTPPRRTSRAATSRAA
jgi:plasmid maintenance system antidote protein VapI